MASYGLKESEIREIILEHVNKATDQMLYLDDSTVDVVKGIADGIAEVILRHVEQYFDDLARHANHMARLRP